MKSRVIKLRDTSTDTGKLTYHGSAPRRDILKHGGQAGRWAYLADEIGRGRGRYSDRTAPRGGRP